MCRELAPADVGVPRLVGLARNDAVALRATLPGLLEPFGLESRSHRLVLVADRTTATLTG